eukprot:274696-Hanusia_phi.AAC.1
MMPGPAAARPVRSESRPPAGVQVTVAGGRSFSIRKSWQGQVIPKFGVAIGEVQDDSNCPISATREEQKETAILKH